MKFKPAFHVFLVIWGVAMLFAPRVNAAIYYWDNNGTTYALSDGDGTSGTWSGVLDAGNTFAIVPTSGILDGTTGLVSLSTAVTKSADAIYFGTNNLSLGTTASTIGTTGIININHIVFGAGQTNAVTLGSGGTIRLVGGSPAITVNNASNTIAAVLDGSLGLTKAGGGTLILSGTNTISGGVSINSGTLQVGNGTSGSLATQDLNFNGTGVFSVVGASAGNTTQSMAYLTFNAGDGTVQSTYGNTGTTTLTLADISSIALGATANFVTTGGNSTNNRIAIDSGSQYAQFTNMYFVKNMFFNGSSYAAYDAGGFLRAVGAGDLFFVSAGAGADMGACSYTDTVLLTGSLSAQGDAQVSSINLAANNITLSGPAALLQTDGLLSSGSSGATITGGKLQTTTAGSDMVIRVNGGSDQLTISSNIEDNAGSMLTKSGAGTLVLSGANTYSGTTTINAGTLAVSGGNGIADTGAVALVNTAGASLRLDNNETIGSLYGGGFAGGNVNVQGNTLTIANAASQTFGGTINGTSGGGLTLSSGTLSLSNKNAFAGTITLLGNSQLTFAYGNDGTSDAPTVSSGGSILMANGTSLQVNPTAQVANGVAYNVSGGAATKGLIYSNDIVITSGTASIKQLSTSTGGRYVFSGTVTGGTSGAQTLAIIQGAGGGAAQKATMTIAGAIQNGSGGTL
ncbi:MAG TPA: autotransporter-associated beta strand repeat-containing protein, partial [Luteolibacter sp.]|nr:autotransporter-associated beta strand repeat-containing protein [Luteolibacter sp.]